MSLSSWQVIWIVTTWVVRAINAGSDDFIEKPVDKQDSVKRPSLYTATTAFGQVANTDLAEGVLLGLDSRSTEAITKVLDPTSRSLVQRWVHAYRDGRIDAVRQLLLFK